jgi:hypothetical protein
VQLLPLLLLPHVDAAALLLLLPLLLLPLLLLLLLPLLLLLLLPLLLLLLLPLLLLLLLLLLLPHLCLTRSAPSGTPCSGVPPQPAAPPA